ncbi:helix-turn-helix transcriptional regulator [Ochrobactrum sp. MR28]|nr:helix-turn-helix transcriptional regulator [Ochrobactrum sp. MR28]MBX8818128.1 helix-turn-helix transcriptional regulator [Ochrobactrum sp. MR31]
MEPTIRDGDVLLVDTSITSVYDNAIYIVVYNGHVLVKRVNLKRDGALTIISDNDRHPPEEVPLAEVPDLHIAGRVMWFGRSI